MDEHRITLDPSVLSRLAESMNHIAEAWQKDVDALNDARGQNETLTRALNASDDRADNMNADLRVVRGEARALLERNAWLEAQLHLLQETTSDARDALTTLIERAARRNEEIPERIYVPPAPIAAAAPVREDGTTAPRPQPQAQPQAAEPPAPPVEMPAAPVVVVEEDDGTGLPAERPLFLRTPLPTIDFTAERPVK